MSAPPAVRTPPSTGRRGRTWLGRLALRRIRRRGLDPSRLRFLPPAARVPLQRIGVDPVPRLAELRVSGPVHRLDLPFDLAVYLVTGAAEAREVLADSAGFSTDVRHLFSGTGPATADDVGGLGPTDPPQHTRLRGLVAPDFTRARMQRLEPAVEETVARALDELAAAGSPADLVRHVATPVPMRTICGLLGLDGADEQLVSRLGARRFDATGGTAGTFGAVSAQRRLLSEAVAAQRRAPGDGLIGRIIRSEGNGVSDAELTGLVDGIVTGGFETTASTIALGTLVLLGDPEAAALVRDGPRRDVERVVDELLRLLSVVQVAFPRFAREDRELFGTHLRAGDVVLVSLSGADRDPAWAGAHPDRLSAPLPPAGLRPRRRRAARHLLTAARSAGALGPQQRAARDAAGSLRTATGMPLSPARGAADRGAMDLTRVIAGTRHAAVRLWRGHVQLWDAFLSADPWDPGPAEHDARPLHWDGPVLVGTVLPGRPR